MRKEHISMLTVAVALASAAVTDTAYAHGFRSKRFFPATLTTDDPFVADELSLPTISSIKTPAGDDGPATRETDFSVDVSKRHGESGNRLRCDVQGLASRRRQHAAWLRQRRGEPQIQVLSERRPR